jgi:hypothetical protein
MKKALISPNEVPQYVTSWVNHQTPVFSPIANSARIAEVAAEDFPVAGPLFWVNCSDEVVADQWYYNTDSETIESVPSNADRPAAENQPESSGTTPL